MEYRYEFKNFQELSNQELIDMLRLRSIIFVVEQNCPYLDMDGYDESGTHLLVKDGPKIIGCLRILPPGRYSEVSLGRVVVDKDYRKQGIAKKMLLSSIIKAKELYNCESIILGAQVYAKKLYETAGFIQIDDGYLEDGIPHIHMKYTERN
jgi:ElaA protein